MKIVYIDGVFDLFHIGHLRLLKNSKNIGDKLIVGVVSDEDANSYKRKPIISYENRYNLINEMDIADLVVKAELNITEEFINKLGINCVIHGDDNMQKSFFKIPRQLNIMKYVPYTTSISTTEIIKKIKNT